MLKNFTKSCWFCFPSEEPFFDEKYLKNDAVFWPFKAQAKNGRMVALKSRQNHSLWFFFSCNFFFVNYILKISIFSIKDWNFGLIFLDFAAIFYVYFSKNLPNFENSIKIWEIFKILRNRSKFSIFFEISD